jgi:hypothetical protein
MKRRLGRNLDVAIPGRGPDHQAGRVGVPPTFDRTRKIEVSAPYTAAFQKVGCLVLRGMACGDSEMAAGESARRPLPLLGPHTPDTHLADSYTFCLRPQFSSRD